LPIWESVGILSQDLQIRTQQYAELHENSEAGQKRRSAFQAAIHGSRFQVQGIGIEMNQRYFSKAVYLKDEGPETAPPSLSKEDAILHYQKTTYPGARLPHAWLNKRLPSKLISTHDLAGKGRFTIFTGIGGVEEWKTAAARVSTSLGIPLIVVYSIGFHQDYEDPYFGWAQLREVDESGCVLVRPDRFVGWRCKTLEKRNEDITEKLLLVMKTLLSLD
jgi:hypothetical protein